MALIILSSAYVSDELQNEFGRIPPAFLPLGNSPAIFEIIKSVSDYTPIILTLPNDYKLAEFDHNKLVDAKVEVRFFDYKMTLCAVMGSIAQHLGSGCEATFLFGDTYVSVKDLKITQSDFIGTGRTSNIHKWSYVDQSNKVEEDRSNIDFDKVICGYMRFSNLDLLAECSKSSKNLSELINCYQTKQPTVFIPAIDWHDFGHLSTYFLFKNRLIGSRHFNELCADHERVRKSSLQRKKLNNEYQWFKSIPDGLKLHTPRIFGAGRVDYSFYYETEYLYFPTLSELFLFGRLTFNKWSSIFTKISELLSKMQLYEEVSDLKIEDQHIRSLFIKKLKCRMIEVQSVENIYLAEKMSLNGKLLPSLMDVPFAVNKCLNDAYLPRNSIFHGDLFFGNMLFDQRSQRIFCIDPRGGVDDGVSSIYGNILYDIAKLAHSIYGLYDFIAADRFYLFEHNEGQFELQIEAPSQIKGIEELFEQKILNKYHLTKKQIKILAGCLFVSMLPLHKDNVERQKALLLTGLRLVGEGSE